MKNKFVVTMVVFSFMRKLDTNFGYSPFKEVHVKSIFSEISSVDSLPITINPSASQLNQNIGAELTNTEKPLPTEIETETTTAEDKPEAVLSRENTFPAKSVPTATELLSASIEKLAKEQPIDSDAKSQTESTTIQAQVKLTQGIVSVARSHPDPKMKDINLNNKTGLYIILFIKYYICIFIQ